MRGEPTDPVQSPHVQPPSPFVYYVCTCAAGAIDPLAMMLNLYNVTSTDFCCIRHSICYSQCRHFPRA